MTPPNTKPRLESVLEENGVKDDHRQRVQALFVDVPDAASRALFERYFTTKRNGACTTQSRVIGLYDPQADRRVFPAGMRYCINVYAGCGHLCGYCYNVNYIPKPRSPRTKADFCRKLDRELRQLDELGVPPFPLHVSNSTDPFQDCLEPTHQHTLHMLKSVLAQKHLFSSVTLLTKNPLLAAEHQYADLLQALDATVEASLIYANDAPREAIEPGAPSVSERLDGMQKLCERGVRTVLRFDPLFARPPLPSKYWDKQRPEDYGAITAHTTEDVDKTFAQVAAFGVRKVVSKVLKLPFGRYDSKKPFKETFLPLFAAAGGGKPLAKGSQWRLPADYASQLWTETEEIAQRHSLVLVHCAKSLCGTR